MKRTELFKWVKESYGTESEYLWSKNPDSAVLRNKNNKWYAAVLNVQKKKIGIDEAGSADVLNVKCDEMMIGSLLMQNGILPAYHMNKNHWISVLLDGSVNEEEIKSLIEMSYQLTGSKK